MRLTRFATTLALLAPMVIGGLARPAGSQSADYAVTLFHSGKASPFGITSGPDGALWFVEQAANKIARVTTSGSFTEYDIPTAGSNPFAITAGPDGALWFTEQGSGQTGQTVGKIGRIMTDGSFTEYTLPKAGTNPAFITAGPDGALWFSQPGTDTVVRMTTAGVLTHEIPVPSTDPCGPEGITAGPDGLIWVACDIAAMIGRISPVPQPPTPPAPPAPVPAAPRFTG